MFTRLEIVNALLLAFISLSRSSPVHSEAKFREVFNDDMKEKALTFGGGNRDHLNMTEVKLDVTTGLSVCFWLKKKFNIKYRGMSTVLEFNPGNSTRGAARVGDTGYHWENLHKLWRLGPKWEEFRVEFQLNNTDANTWRHVCWVWEGKTWHENLETYLPTMTTLYRDGKIVSSVVTVEDKPFPAGGELFIGRDRYNWTSERHYFEGDMFKLNIYNKSLTVSEIRRMASDICSSEEKKLTENRILKWEDIVGRRRHLVELGEDLTNLTEYSMARCLSQDQKILWLMEERAKETAVELREIRGEADRNLIILTALYGVISVFLLILLITLRVQLNNAIKHLNTGTN